MTFFSFFNHVDRLAFDGYTFYGLYTVLINHELSIFLRFGSGGALPSTCFDLAGLDLVSDTLGDTATFVLFFLTTTPFRVFLKSFLIVNGLAVTGAADIV